MSTVFLFDTLKENKVIIDDLDIRYYGLLPEKSVFISVSKKSNERILESVYSSSLEIFLSGYSIAYIYGSRASRYIEKAAIDCKGKVFIFFPYSLNHSNRKCISYALLSSGGAIGFDESVESITSDNMAKARYIASKLSDIILFADECANACPYNNYIDQSIEDGKELAILKPALSNRRLRELARDGCPVISSFSDFLVNPEYIAYNSLNGRYRKNNFSFDIINLNEY